MFSAVDGFRTTTINVAGGYISTFSSTEVRTSMPDSTGSVLYLAGGADDLQWLKINNDTGARISGQKKIGDATNPETGLFASKDSSNNVYLVGQSYTSSTYTPAYIAKISTSGSLTWQKDYFDTTQSDISGIFRDVACESGGGNIYCSGTVNKLVGSQYTGIPSLVKYNSSGVVQYQERSGYASSGNLVYNLSIIQDLAVDDYNKLYVTGYYQTYDFGSSQFLTSSALQKRYANGTVEWDYSLNASGNSTFSQSVVDSSNNVFYSGYYENDGGGWLLGKLYSNGVQAWQQTYSNTNINSICLDNTGNLYVAGRLVPDYNTGFYLNIDVSTGNINWQNFINSSEGNIYFNDINYSNSFIYAGGFQQAYTGNYPGFTMKLPSDGNTTGTYGQFTFSTGNITSSTSNLSGTGTALNFGSITYSNAAGSLPIGNGNSTRKIIPL